MQEKKFSELFDKFYDKTYSPVEKQEFLHLVDSVDYDDELTRLVDSKYERLLTIEDHFSDEKKSQILSNILNHPPLEKDRPHLVKMKGKRIHFLQAAAILLVLGAGFIYYKATRNNTPLAIVYQNDVPSGGVGATLTLANGKQINLNSSSNGEIASVGGIVIKKSKEGKLVYQIVGTSKVSESENTLSTKNGETYEVELPDGTHVWLNAASNLTYSANLHSQRFRRVRLEGEAYFEVAKDSKHPFIVESMGQQVEVLGTHFNINAYPSDKAIKTTLVEGSVKVSQGNEVETLKPGFEASTTQNGIVVRSVDTDLATAWKDGKFIFEDLSVGQIMKIVERWYDVEIIYSDDIPTDIFAGSVSRSDNVSHVLTILESTGRVHFKIVGRKIYVSK